MNQDRDRTMMTSMSQSKCLYENNTGTYVERMFTAYHQKFWKSYDKEYLKNLEIERPVSFNGFTTYSIIKNQGNSIDENSRSELLHFLQDTSSVMTKPEAGQSSIKNEAVEEVPQIQTKSEIKVAKKQQKKAEMKMNNVAKSSLQVKTDDNAVKVKQSIAIQEETPKEQNSMQKQKLRVDKVVEESTAQTKGINAKIIVQVKEAQVGNKQKNSLTEMVEFSIKAKSDQKVVNELKAQQHDQEVYEEEQIVSYYDLMNQNSSSQQQVQEVKVKIQAQVVEPQEVIEPTDTNQDKIAAQIAEKEIFEVQADIKGDEKGGKLNKQQMEPKKVNQIIQPINMDEHKEEEKVVKQAVQVNQKEEVELEETIYAKIPEQQKQKKEIKENQLHQKIEQPANNQVLREEPKKSEKLILQQKSEELKAKQEIKCLQFQDSQNEVFEEPELIYDKQRTMQQQKRGEVLSESNHMSRSKIQEQLQGQNVSEVSQSDSLEQKIQQSVSSFFNFVDSQNLCHNCQQTKDLMQINEQLRIKIQQLIQANDRLKNNSFNNEVKIKELEKKVQKLEQNQENYFSGRKSHKNGLKRDLSQGKISPNIAEKINEDLTFDKNNMTAPARDINYDEEAQSQKNSSEVENDKASSEEYVNIGFKIQDENVVKRDGSSD